MPTCAADRISGLSANGAFQFRPGAAPQEFRVASGVSAEGALQGGSRIDSEDGYHLNRAYSAQLGEDRYLGRCPGYIVAPLALPGHVVL